MNGEIPPGINPKELVQQEGLNKGNIADMELAEIGAKAEDRQRDEVNSRRSDGLSRGVMTGDNAGMDAMQDEVYERTQGLDLGKVSEKTKEQIGEVAVEKFKAIQAEKVREDQKKADEILKKLKEM